MGGGRTSICIEKRSKIGSTIHHNGDIARTTSPEEQSCLRQSGVSRQTASTDHVGKLRGSSGNHGNPKGLHESVVCLGYTHIGVNISQPCPWPSQGQLRSLRLNQELNLCFHHLYECASMPGRNPLQSHNPNYGHRIHAGLWMAVILNMS